VGKDSLPHVQPSTFSSPSALNMKNLQSLACESDILWIHGSDIVQVLLSQKIRRQNHFHFGKHTD
jgi:hypothetical protein